MNKVKTFIFAFAVCAHIGVQAKTCDDIKDKVHRARCKAGKESARAYKEEADAWNRAARLRDKICIADSVAAGVAAKMAGWRGKIVYKGTRAAANWASKGASKC